MVYFPNMYIQFLLHKTKIYGIVVQNVQNVCLPQNLDRYLKNTGTQTEKQVVQMAPTCSLYTVLRSRRYCLPSRILCQFHRQGSAFSHITTNSRNINLH